jgi:hypothetical protein
MHKKPVLVQLIEAVFNAQYHVIDADDIQANAACVKHFIVQHIEPIVVFVVDIPHVAIGFEIEPERNG